MKRSVLFQNNREMPCVADNRKCSPPAVENKVHASGNLKDLLRDIVGFILYIFEMGSNFFTPITLKVYPILQTSPSSTHAMVNKMINNLLIRSAIVICPTSVVTHHHCPRRAPKRCLQTGKLSLVP